MMKRVVIANKFYYNRGGDCIASIALEKLLRSKGHDVAFFSMQYPQNFHSEWERFYPNEVDFNGGIAGKLVALGRVFSSREVKRKFSAFIDVFKPDVLHLNNVHSYLSPVIGEIAHEKGIKVVWSLHDYKLICPTYLCLRNGHPCTLCVKGMVSNVLSEKCMKGSLPASLIAYLEALYWNRKRLMRNTDHFIAPSHCMKSLMEEGGFTASKITVVPHFTDRSYPSIIGKAAKEDYYCFIGRLSEEKGIATLVEVANRLPYPLYVIGTGPLKDKLCGESHVRFLGFKDWDEIQRILSKARFLVSPSECYEVFGLSNIEAQCLGTPVLGADIGGIPETIDVPSCGMLFEAGNKIDLEDKIKLMFERSFNYKRIAEVAKERFSADNYYKEIIKIYEQ